ncbi:hypothetical protein [Flavobacterium soyangense]|uniref:Uncharacterized protein n=1 Tax=Flavobacterium soyangense TaxID=2023265 RepID=A0A930UCY5_9FLAO|nr:hypothetical protein [Flavobacterium soyangense]MBF2709775.1 hypothetical protein [Flavobacterium soyangense]
MKKVIIITLFCIISLPVNSQILVALASGSSPYIPKTKVLEKFPLYPTIKKFNFNGKELKIIFRDIRDSLNTQKVECSEIEIKNKSEFKSELGAKVVKSYLDSLFVNSNIKINNENNENIVKIELKVLDGRVVGFMLPQAHSICQMTFKYKQLEKNYCVDLKDGDLNAPVGRTTMISKSKAITLMTCASIREVIELFLVDLNNYSEN